ncbi:hypothetical protein BANRA_05008 [Escherichia coli]|nr:hypothetical protein BANRA_05008 [Escherichia coli]
MSLRKQAHSTKGVEVGRIFAGIIFCVCLITLKAQMNSGGATLGDVSFGPSVMRANLRLAWEPQQSTQCWDC